MSIKFLLILTYVNIKAVGTIAGYEAPCYQRLLQFL